MNDQNSNHIDLRDLDSDRQARAKLVEQGWTPPKHAVDQPQVPTRAWMHPIANLVSTDAHAYKGLSTGKERELVFKSDVHDHIDWLEHGIEEWRAVAMQAMEREKALAQALSDLATTIRFTPLGLSSLKSLQRADATLAAYSPWANTNDANAAPDRDEGDRANAPAETPGQ